MFTHPTTLITTALAVLLPFCHADSDRPGITTFIGHNCKGPGLIDYKKSIDQAVCIDTPRVSQPTSLSLIGSV